MGRIIAAVDVGNAAPQGGAKRVAMLVDTGATHLTLPLAWKPQFGAFETEQAVQLYTATGERVAGALCGPARIQVEGFRVAYGEVLFIEMAMEGECQPLLGYLPLEQCGVAVDMESHRLVPGVGVQARLAA